MANHASIRIARQSEPTRVRAPGSACIWAVGGGKGGVGKSVVTSNLAVALAGRGQRCVVVDLDLGGANLHTVLGVPSPRRTLSHFVNGEVAQLSDVMCQTSIPNVRLISGARALLAMANPKYSQKTKILRHIHQLDVDHVLLDLGAGTSFNVLDFFLAAQRGIIVVEPEPTSIENAYEFLKAAFFRSLRSVAKRPAVRAAIDRALEGRGRLQSPRDLIAAVAEIDREAGKLLQERAEAFRPSLIVNQARSREHRSVGREISVVCHKFLGAELDYVGVLGWDECVLESIRRRQPALQLFPASPFSQDLVAIAKRLLGQEARAWREELACASRDARVRRDAVANVEAAAPPPLAALEPGAYLRHCRKQRGLELAQLAHQTRIRALKQIENERFDELPPEPYLQGFILQYARALEIRNAEFLVASFMKRYCRARGKPA
jgi:flagellar biosynthesis protein FlhG